MYNWFVVNNLKCIRMSPSQTASRVPLNLEKRGTEGNGTRDTLSAIDLPTTMASNIRGVLHVLPRLLGQEDRISSSEQISLYDAKYDRQVEKLFLRIGVPNDGWIITSKMGDKIVCYYDPELRAGLYAKYELGNKSYLDGSIHSVNPQIYIMFLSSLENEPSKPELIDAHTNRLSYQDLSQRREYQSSNNCDIIISSLLSRATDFSNIDQTFMKAFYDIQLGKRLAFDDTLSHRKNWLAMHTISQGAGPSDLAISKLAWVFHNEHSDGTWMQSLSIGFRVATLWLRLKISGTSEIRSALLHMICREVPRQSAKYFIDRLPHQMRNANGVLQN